MKRYIYFILICLLHIKHAAPNHIKITYPVYQTMCTYIMNAGGNHSTFMQFFAQLKTTLLPEEYDYFLCYGPTDLFITNLCSLDREQPLDKPPITRNFIEMLEEINTHAANTPQSSLIKACYYLQYVKKKQISITPFDLKHYLISTQYTHKDNSLKLIYKTHKRFSHKKYNAQKTPLKTPRFLPAWAKITGSIGGVTTLFALFIWYNAQQKPENASL